MVLRPQFSRISESSPLSDDETRLAQLLQSLLVSSPGILYEYAEVLRVQLGA